MGSGHRYQRSGITSELQLRWISLSISALGTPGMEGAGRFPHPSSEGEGSAPRLPAEVSSTTYRGGGGSRRARRGRKPAQRRSPRTPPPLRRAQSPPPAGPGHRHPANGGQGFQKHGEDWVLGQDPWAGSPGDGAGQARQEVRRWEKMLSAPQGLCWGHPQAENPPGQPPPPLREGERWRTRLVPRSAGADRRWGHQDWTYTEPWGQPSPPRRQPRSPPTPTTAFEFSWRRSSGERAEAINDRPSAGNAGAGAGPAAGTRWRRGHAAPPRDTGERDGLRASLPPLGTHFWASISLDLALYLCSRPAASCSSRSRRSLSSRCRSSSALLFSSSRRFSSSF